MASNNPLPLNISLRRISDEILNIRKLWVQLAKTNRFISINSLNHKESLILINQISSAQGLSPIDLTVKFHLEIGCNANCIMCNTTEFPISNNTYAKITKLLDYLNLPTVSHVSLVDGEPLLDKAGLIGFMQESSKKGLKTCITTNGSLLTEQYIDLLVSNGLEEIVVSLDSDNADMHDRIRRKKGLFDSAINGIKYLRYKYPQVDVRINSVIMSINVQSLLGIIQMANMLRVTGLNIIYILNRGRSFEKLRLRKKNLLVIEIIKNDPIVRNSNINIVWDLCRPEQSTGNVNGHFKITVLETGEIFLGNNYNIERKFFLNKSLDSIFLEDNLAKYFYPDNFTLNNLY